MKRLLALVLAVVMAFSFSGCSKEVVKIKCLQCSETFEETFEFCPHCGYTATVTTTNTTTTTTTQATKAKVTKAKTTKASQTPQITKATVTKAPQTTKAPATQPAHKHSYTKKVVNPTCTDKGYTLYTCACGHSYKDNYVNAKHNYVKFKCSACGTVDKAHAREYLVLWLEKNGTAAGEYVHYRFNDEYVLSCTADGEPFFGRYLTLQGESFLYALSLRSYKYMLHGGNLEVIGILNAQSFTSNSAISYDEYTGDENFKYDMIENARVAVCDLIETLEYYLADKKIGITIADLGFKSY